MPRCNTNSMRFISGHSQALVTCPTGASHMEKGQPCQDACMVSQHYIRGVPYTILAVADGHGSAKYSRSDLGAHFAVMAASDAVTELAMALSSICDNNLVEWQKYLHHEVTHRLGRTLLRRWISRVEEHASENFEEGISPDSDAWLGRYGSTLSLTVLYDNKWLISASLGDSAIYTVHKNTDDYSIHEVAASDLDDLGLSTDSLISPRANYMWRYEITSIENPPSMILLTTDGLTDSLEKPEDTIVDLCRKAHEHGMTWLEQVLPKQLARWSVDGVGDDMGCIVWLPNLQPISQKND